MFRRLAPLLMLSITLPSLALARDPAVAEQRAATKEARHHARDVDRLARRWTRAAEKGKAEKVAELDQEVRALVNDELARLRTLGVQSKPDRPVATQPGKHLPYDQPKREQLRDELLELRGLAARHALKPAKVDRTAALLDDLSERADERRELAERQLDRVKARA